jgi:hypothetical protein
MNPDIHLLCEVPATVNVHRAECSLSDADAHLLPNFLLAVCLTAAIITENKEQVALGYKMKKGICGRGWKFGT